MILSIILIVPGQGLSGQALITQDQNSDQLSVNVPGKPARNAIYIELAGPGVLYSMNYERRITDHLGVRAGVSLWSIDSLDLILLQIKNFKYRSFPVMITYLIGKRASHLELGLGIQPTFLEGDFDVFYFIHSNEKSKGKAILGLSTIGYRYQKKESGLIFRIGVSPVFASSGMNPAVGASLGFGF